MLTRVHLIVVLALVASACGGAPPSSQAPSEPAPKQASQLGSWNGQGSTTLGFVSESGSFRINWVAQNIDNAKPGHFTLTLRSGISGRPLKVIADHESAGGGSVEFGDDPRLYEFVIDSTGINWTITVEETWAPSRR